jgi:hypothetical protein
MGQMEATKCDSRGARGRLASCGNVLIPVCRCPETNARLRQRGAGGLLSLGSGHCAAAAAKSGTGYQ